MTNLGRTDLDVSPLCLGGNVFGWTADRTESFAVLDAYVEAGGNFIDTADRYSVFAPGNRGGESETIIGQWMRERGNRDRIVVATKVGQMPGLEGLAPATIETALERSLARLQTDYVDLYYAHTDDLRTPLADTLGAFDRAVGQGKVRHLAASNYTAGRLAEALEVSAREGLARYEAVQPHYSLVERTEYEGALSELCMAETVSCIPFWSLARGFLTGKYRPGVSVDSPRAGDASAYLDPRGLRVLAALDEVAAGHGTTVAAVALAWVRAQPGVLGPIASARNVHQLADSLAMIDLELTDADLQALSHASRIQTG